MADKVSNPYIELFEQLPIPERLEPNNIAAMLDERAAKSAAPEKPSPVKAVHSKPSKAKVVPVEPSIKKASSENSASEKSAKAEKVPDNKTDPAPKGKHKSLAVFRAVVAIAACAALVFGIMQYMGAENPEPPADTYVGGAFASDYDDIYNSLRRLSFDGAESKTLDSVIEDIRSSYGGNDGIIGEPVVSGDVSGDLPLPENGAVIDNTGVVFGDGFMLLRDGLLLRVFDIGSGDIEYTDNILPVVQSSVYRDLIAFYAEGNKAVAVYSRSDSSVEVDIYEITDGKAALSSVTVHDGTLIDYCFVNGSLYLVTAYSDYLAKPILDAQDIESYVPSYVFNGDKYYVQASDIMIPDYISTTDYAVISGISLDGGVSVKAVLGYEGRVLMTNSAVYVFGYDSLNGSDTTSVKTFSLTDGSIVYDGSVIIEGVVLDGDGISAFGGAIALTSVCKSGGGYVTALGLYDESMNIISKVDFPAALTYSKRYGNNLYLGGANDKYGVDLSDPSAPALISETPVKDMAEGLVGFDGGYVTLTKSADGGLTLAKLAKNESGELSLEYKTAVTSEAGAFSKALENNGLLFVSGNVVGLPYGYFDGVDYCYRYALYRAADAGFEPIGHIESHEVDEAYEYVGAVLSGGVIYIFSDGRVCTAAVGDAFELIDAVDIVESVYGRN